MDSGFDAGSEGVETPGLDAPALEDVPGLDAAPIEEAEADSGDDAGDNRDGS
jgi:hypothetical protein